eukprot:TRINITY_DN71419_c0_g1_i1.p1 TRINITY_DN71419_c0_g1~~TRINITY_DN71419_c0_g1_i1.p1  ORF type:complete len:147 (+),score=17.63 TRINITY_DN71419_c0_g1_i1:140-580(+)
MAPRPPPRVVAESAARFSFDGSYAVVVALFVAALVPAMFAVWQVFKSSQWKHNLGTDGVSRSLRCLRRLQMFAILVVAAMLPLNVALAAAAVSGTNGSIRPLRVGESALPVVSAGVWLPGNSRMDASPEFLRVQVNTGVLALLLAF